MDEDRRFERDYHFATALAYLARARPGDADKGRHHLRAALAADPGFAAARDALATSGAGPDPEPPFLSVAYFRDAERHLSRDDRAAAMAALRRAVELEPSNQAAALKLLDLLRHAGDLEGCVALCRQMADGDAQWQHRLGTLLNLADRATEAEQAFRQALALDPGLVPCLVELGLLYSRADRLDEALAIAERLGDLDSGRAHGLRLRANVLRWLQRETEARACFDQAVTLQPRNPWTYIDRAIFLLSSGDFAGAQADLDQALALEAEFPQALNLMGLCQHCRGQWDVAEQYYRRSIARAPELGYFKSSLGLLLMQRGALAEADALTAEAEAGSVRTPWMDYCRAAVLAAQGNEAAAEDYRRRIGELDRWTRASNDQIMNLVLSSTERR